MLEVIVLISIAMSMSILGYFIFIRINQGNISRAIYKGMGKRQIYLQLLRQYIVIYLVLLLLIFIIERSI